MYKSTTTINTLSEIKNPEKFLGLNQKVKMQLNINGIYNLPNELKMKNPYTISYDFELYLLDK